MYDDINTSNITMDMGNLSNTNRDTKVNFDSTTNTTTESKSKAGTITYKDLNLSSSSSHFQFIKSLSENVAGRGSAIVKKMSDTDPDLSRYSVDDLKDLTADKLKTVYTNKKRVASLQNAQDSITTLLNNFGSQSTIKCYIKRQLTPSFYCPLSGKNNSYYTGGVANTTQEDAQKKCNEYCQTQKSCVSSPVKGFTNQSKVTYINKYAPTSFSVALSNKQILKGLEIFIKGNSNEQHVYMNVTGTIDGKKVAVVDNYDFKLTTSLQSVYFPVTLKNFTKLDVNFLSPFTFNENIRNKQLVAGSKNVLISKAVLHYASDKYWFCPTTQFVKNKNYCKNGIVVSKIIAGSPELICIRKADRMREETLGAYYSEATCNQECFEREECVPTYRHLANGITSSIYNVDYGCMSGQDNTSCTKALCKEKIFANVVPNHEQVYYNDTQRETTIENGQPVEGTIRPIYNMAAEMSTNGKSDKKKELMVSTSKDMAYRSMIRNKTYVISEKALKDVYPLQAQAIKIGGNGVSIEYLPPSNLFNTGKASYVYFVTANYYNFTEEDAFIPQTYRSINYTIADGNGNLKLFFIKDKEQVISSRDINVSSITPVEYSGKQELKKTVGSDGQLAAYSLSSLAPFTSSKVFDSSKYKFEYTLSSNYLKKANLSSGASLKRQAVNGGAIKKYYSGTADSTGGTVYKYELFLIISSTRLTYQNIIDKIKKEDAVKVFSSAFSNSFTKEIKGHASADYNGRAIKIFILGTDKHLSLIGELKPQFGEEGKDAFVFNFLYKKK